MIIAMQAPRPPLNRFAEFLWFHEGYSCNHQLERVLPDGSMELIINLRNEDRHVFDRVAHRPRQSYPAELAFRTALGVHHYRYRPAMLL